jgi:hypothetical protein
MASNIFKIPFFGVKRQYENLRQEILDTVDTVYTSGQVLDGQYTRYFKEPWHCDVIEPMLWL